MYSHTKQSSLLPLLTATSLSKSVFLVVGIANLNLCSKEEITRSNYI